MNYEFSRALRAVDAYILFDVRRRDDAHKQGVCSLIKRWEEGERRNLDVHIRTVLD